MTRAADVERNIELVEGTRAKAVEKLTGTWFRSSDADAALSSLRSLKDTVGKWAKNGRYSVNAGKLPGKNGWAGWVRAGRAHLDGIHDLVELGDKGMLTDIADQAVEAIVTAPEVVATGVKKTTKTVASIVGTTTASLVTPLLLPIIVIIAVAVGLFVIARMVGVF